MIVDVIVATYNGEKYIKEQVCSILNQTYKDIRVLVRDDGSTDNTKSIILELQKKDNRLHLIEDDYSPNGVGENFKRLLEQCSSEYVFIADQDDVWEVNKIEELVSYANKTFPANIPCIAYAPGLVVDQNLLSSEIKFTNNSIKVRNLEDMILMNGGVQGCAMIINRNLYEKALRSDFYWYMHDQVLSLYAICYGKIFFYNKPLFKYRQHQNNVLGFNGNTFISRLKKYTVFDGKSFLINKHTDQLFVDFWHSGNKTISAKDKKIFIDYFSAKENKIKFFLFVVKNRICIRKKLSTSLVKMLLIKNLIEK